MSRRLREGVFVALCWAAVYLPLGLLAVLIGNACLEGLPRLDAAFFSQYPSPSPERAGILPAMVGSIYLIILTSIIALPIGIGAAIYLEEFARDRLSTLIEVNLTNLAGVPSVLYGLLGLGIFVRTLGMGTGLAAGALTLATLVLPLVIITSREAMRAVPVSAREAAVALGATRWETVRQVVLPVAWPRIVTGTILAVSRALGEAAPLIVVGGVAYVTFLPDGMGSSYTVLPMQIFHWVSRAREGFVPNAAAAVLVLLAVTMTLNAFAVLLRNRLIEEAELDG